MRTRLVALTLTTFALLALPAYAWNKPGHMATGAIAYAAGWLLIPEEGEATSLGENAVRDHSWGRIAGFVLIAVAASLLLRPLWWFGGHLITAVALILLGLYLLSHRGGDDQPTDTAPTPPPPPAQPESQTGHERTYRWSPNHWMRD